MQPATIVLAGEALQLLDENGKRRWLRADLGVSLLLRVADLDATGRLSAVVRTDPTTILVLDAQNGREVWRWHSPPGTFLHDHGGLAWQSMATGERLLIFPTYALEGWAFDFSGDREHPRVLWHLRVGRWDAGFGPSIIIAELDDGGRPQVLLSSRIGEGWRGGSAQPETSQLVIGRRRGQVYQAILDIDTGELQYEGAFAPDPRRQRVARPYGLFTTARSTSDGPLEVVLVSCQVEEFLAVSRLTDDRGLTRRWGRFIEKDWPRDERELRPQPTSVADLDGDGRDELAVGLWQDGEWRTLMLDLAAGYDRPKAILDGRYLWGCEDVDGDGRPEFIVSRESARAPAPISVLELRDGATMEIKAVLPDAAVVASADGPLPEGTAFLAVRRSAVAVADDLGRRGVLVRRFRGERELGTYRWGIVGRAAWLERVTGPGVTVVASSAGGMALARASGRVETARARSPSGGTGGISHRSLRGPPGAHPRRCARTARRRGRRTRGRWPPTWPIQARRGMAHTGFAAVSPPGRPHRGRPGVARRTHAGGRRSLGGRRCRATPGLGPRREPSTHDAAGTAGPPGDAPGGRVRADAPDGNAHARDRGSGPMTARCGGRSRTRAPTCIPRRST